MSNQNEGPKIVIGGNYTLGLFGPENTPDHIWNEAKRLGADPEQICFMKSASDQRFPGFSEIHHPEFGPCGTEDHIETDGIIRE